MPEKDFDPAKKNTSESPWPELDKADSFFKKSAELAPKNQPSMNQPSLPPPRYLLGAGVIGGCIILALGVYFMFGQMGNQNVSLEFSKPDRVYSGEPFGLSVSFANNSDKALGDAVVSLTLPDGVSFLGQAPDQRVLEQSLGDLGPGSLNQQTFNLISAGPTGSNSQTQSLRHLAAKLSYGDSGHRYARDASIDLLVGQPAATLNVDAPKTVLSGDTFDVTFTYQNNTNQALNNLHLSIDYAPNYKFSKSSLPPVGGTSNEWNLESINPGENKKVVVTGSAVGPENSNFGFNANITADVDNAEYQVMGQNTQLAISSAPLSLSIVANSNDNFVAELGGGMNYELKYKNNSDITFQNVTIKAQLVGEMFDFASPETNGSFNSVVNTFTWLTANTPELSSLAPGQAGSITLDIKIKDAFPIRRLSDKNYTLKVQAQIESPTVPDGSSLAKTTSVTNLETKVKGKIAVNAKAYWRDAASGILNAGPYPPKVNQATQYTVHWLVSNYGTDTNNVRVSAYLQSGAKCTGTFKSNWSSQPTCDPNSGLVSWNVGSVSATKGVIGDPIEGIFQIEATPPATASGDDLVVLGDTSIDAQDVFTNSQLHATDGAVTTLLPDDTSVSAPDRTVQQ